MNPFRFTTAMLSSAGGRKGNEDACASRGHCWVVADGLGGHGGGEIASKLAVKRALELLADTAVDAQRLTAAIDQINETLRAEQQRDPRLSRMHTTLVVLVSDGYHARWVHVGDTRLYHFRNGLVAFQTRDHSVPQALAAAGEIDPSEIRGHDDRNRLLRSLGSDKPPRPSLGEATLAAEDAFLLCTDGFWELITETDMELLLVKAKSPQHWLETMATRVAERAAPDHDNYTALAVFVHS